ncbi:hypothetical protein [Paenibacillus puerhi]|uniref:hypothetical protein n=1 Tax=Paenibacillus puerhi TaxID=2692622 RepID=UPI00135957B4|nr:hypothetical protein [Paenibacillus puerhi]
MRLSELLTTPQGARFRILEVSSDIYTDPAERKEVIRLLEEMMNHSVRIALTDETSSGYFAMDYHIRYYAALFHKDEIEWTPLGGTSLRLP